VRRGHGFTLVELLVALFITAILFAMGYGALTQALNSRKEVEEQAARLTDVQQALRVMEQDFELMQPRPVRDVLGSGYQNAVITSQNALGSSSGASSNGTGMAATSAGAAARSAAQQSLALLSITRGGWANPAGLPRSELQRVSYLIRDGKLIRQHTPVLDATAAVQLEERELLDQVEALGFRFMDASLAWQDRWPTPLTLNGPPQQVQGARPVAIEITLKLKDWGTLTRIIEVAG
jgi:general secretion pathway protein J